MITIEHLKKKIDSNARLIGLDLGTKRIGVAIWKSSLWRSY